MFLTKYSFEIKQVVIDSYFSGNLSSRKLAQKHRRDLRRRIAELKQQTEDRAYLKKKLFVENGVLPNDVNQQDYFELLEIMEAKPREERPLDAGEAHRRLSEIMG